MRRFAPGPHRAVNNTKILVRHQFRAYILVPHNDPRTYLQGSPCALNTVHINFTYIHIKQQQGRYCPPRPAVRAALLSTFASHKLSTRCAVACLHHQQQHSSSNFRLPRYRRRYTVRCGPPRRPALSLSSYVSIICDQAKMKEVTGFGAP